MSAETNSKPSSIDLAYVRPNGTAATQKPPIIFLHGSESCHLEFSRVAQFLESNYDIILVDLPGHSGSRTIPFTFDNAINGILHIINTHIKSNKVTLVGLSLGGFIALELARRHPDVVESIFCTGCTPFSGFNRWVRSHTLLLSGVITLVGKVATDKMFWASFGKDVQPVPGMREEAQKNQNVATLKPVFDELMTVTWGGYGEVPAVRICIVAGGKQDNVEDAARAGRMFREKNEGCRAFVVRKAIHWWSLQDPELFAAGVRAWVDGRDMPGEYEDLLRDAEPA